MSLDGSTSDGRATVTAEDIARAHKALEAAKGDRKFAAEILGIEPGRLAMWIARYPQLHAQWSGERPTQLGEVKVKDEIDAVARTLPKPLALTEPQRMAIALEMNEKKLNKSLAKLGFKQNEITAISNVEEFAGEHFQSTLSIMHGGLLKSAMRLMLLAERIESTYLQDESLEERDRKYWWDTYFRILEKLRDFNEQTNKAALTKALIEMKKKESGGGMSKPGFSPQTAIQINVPSGSSIKTNGASQVG